MSNNHVHPAFDPVFEAIADLSRLATDLMPLNAIWLEKPLQMEGKRSMRIAKGDSVLIGCDWNFQPKLLDMSLAVPPSHEILECRGNLYNTLFEVDLKDLKTGELLTIKL